MPEFGYVAENRGMGYRAIVRELARAGMLAPKPEDFVSYFRLTLVARGDGRAEQPVAGATSVASAAAKPASPSSLDAEQRRIVEAAISVLQVRYRDRGASIAQTSRLRMEIRKAERDAAANEVRGLCHG